MTLTELFTNIANAIRGKDGTTEAIPAEEFAARIENINAKVVGYTIVGNGAETISKSGVSDTFASVYDHMIDNKEIYCSIYAASAVASQVETGRYIYSMDVYWNVNLNMPVERMVYRDNSVSGKPLGVHSGEPLSSFAKWTRDSFVITTPYVFASDLTYRVVFWSENIG